MFATKLLLRYAVKPASPPRNIVPQEITRSFQHEPHVKQYTTTCISKTEANQAIQDANLIKSLRLQKHKLCSRSEPKRPSRRTLSEVEQAIINHPNFEKAAVLVQLLGDNAFVSTANKPVPHQIGSVPRRKFQNDAHPDVSTAEKAVELVKHALKVSKATKVEEEHDIVKVEPEVVIKKKIEHKKPYVINIYLDTKQNKTLEDVDIKKKIKEFWEENVKAIEKKNVKEIEKKHRSETIKEKTNEKTVKAVGNDVIERMENMVQGKVVEKEEIPRTPQAKIEKLKRKNALGKEETSKMKEEGSVAEEVVEENVQNTPKKKLKTSPRIASNFPRENEDLEEDTVESETSYDRPRYRASPVQKLYPNPTSTANPHTERLAGGTPRNYDLEERIKKMVARVTPVNTGGFSKYLTFWKDMWAKKQETKENRNENSSSKEDHPKQPFKRIQGDKVFKEEKRARKNPFEPELEEQESVEKTSKEYVDEAEIDSGKSPKSSYKQQQRNYSTTTNFKPRLRGPHEDGHLCGKSKGTTHIQIMERASFNRRSLEHYQKTHFSTLCKPIYRCDAKTAGGIGSKESKSSQTRVDEFVDKLKDALAVQTKGDYKEVKVLYGGKQETPKREIKVNERNWSTSHRKENEDRMSKREQNEEIDIKRKFQSIKNKIESDE